jgi:hypothetical protein
MNKVILLVLLMPVMAFGQNREKFNRNRITDINHKADSVTGVACPGDVIISEIMADPSPAVDLPEKEYIEIYNRTERFINLNNWIFSDGNSRSVFPECVLSPRSFMILCQVQDTIFFTDYGPVTGLKSFPALTNSGKVIFIGDINGSLIHGIEYSSDWYGDNLKSGGGWSLEIIDPDYPFHQKGNWHASGSKCGGTPGKINSVTGFNPDTFFKGIENVFPSDCTDIEIRFSETLFDFDTDIENIYIDEIDIINVIPSDPLLRSFTIKAKIPLHRGRIYTLGIADRVTDFASNKAIRNEFSFGIPEKPGSGHIRFNELLFNPFPGESDFIEFHNCSDKILNVHDLLLVSVKDDSNDTSSVVFVSDEDRCILQGYNNVITENRDLLLNRFFASDADYVFEVSNMPSMPDDNGHLILYNRNLEKIDEVFYDEGMHYPLLSNEEGISLEKIRPCSLSSDRSQWHSASESSGWGTPGSSNSVLTEHSENTDLVTLSSTRVTPDNDGFEDFLVIDLKLSGIGNVVSVTVFDETGYFIKKVADNLFAGSEASIVWDGTTDDQKVVSTGIYILLIEVYDDRGKLQRWKRVCTIIR